MPVETGRTLAYGRFRQGLALAPQEPVLWNWAELLRDVEPASASEQARIAHLALAREGADPGAEVAPGLALSLQALEPGACIESHSHSWWHIFVVQAGEGVLRAGEPETEREMRAGDVVFVPAWCRHRLSNSGDARLTMLNVSNMVEQLRLSNFRPPPG